MHPDGKGPITSAYVSRPTCKAELCRQAGIFGVRPCRVYAGTDTEPLADDEAINLASGCVVTFLQQDVLPNFSNDLQFRLQFPEVWPAAPAFPPPPAPSALLLLHRRGRHLFRLQAGDLPADEAAARFIGVARATVDIYVPAGDGCSSLMHQGVSLRGVLAFVERDTLPVDAAQYIVFLDMRQLALGVKFLTLARPSIPRDQLAALVGRQPPPSWRLRVQGGRMRRDRLDFQTGETLTFGFEFAAPDSDMSSESFSPTTPADADEGGEGGESESDRASDHSEATTRSRSRRRTAGDPGRLDQSSDHSYQGGFEGPSSPGDGPAFPPHSRGPPAGAQADVHAADCEQIPPQIRVLAPDPRHGAACLVNLDPATLAQDPSRACGSRQCRVPDTATGSMPATGDNAQPGQEPAPRPRWGRQDTGLPPPVFTAPRPDIDQMPPDLDHLLARLVLFAPEYKPEVIDVDLPTGCTEAQVLAALRTQRAPSIAEAFPDVVFVHPQPVGAFALAIALPSWTTDQYILLDCTRVNGVAFCALCAEVTTRASLLAIARLPRDPAIEVYVHDRALPLLDHDAIGIRTGYSVTFAYAQQRAFAVTDIHSMLQDPLVWDWGVPLPFWAGTWSLLLTDDEPMQLMHEAPGLPPDRAALAEALEYDLDRLVSQATAPNIGDHFDFGIWSLDTCIVSQEVRPAPGAVLYALDMRPILCGLTWGLAGRPHCQSIPLLMLDGISACAIGRQAWFCCWPPVPLCWTRNCPGGYLCPC